MMGLFDGAAGGSNEGSSAEIAGWLDAGIVLVVDASAMARSVGALVHGFDTFDREVRVSGVIANRLGGRGHLELVKSAVERIPVWGGIPLDADAAFAERHLGLVAADQDGLLASRLERCADLIEEWLDIDALVHAASSATSRVESTSSRVVSAPTGRCRIGIARDAAFSFYYDDNLRRLVECGATLVDCSPMRDAALPDVDGLYLGGGYPEIHAAALEANASFRASVRRFAEAGAPIYAECGGLMYLSRGIRTLGGQRHEMVGLLPAETTMKDRLAAIGYVEATVAADGILGPAGTRLRGHQFRYSELTAVDAHDPAYTLTSPWNAKETREGFHAGNVVASYVHAHFASNPDAPRRFVNACARHSSPSL
jgi:cobyrinic acid a,c-diamide synthase